MQNTSDTLQRNKSTPVALHSSEDYAVPSIPTATPLRTIDAQGEPNDDLGVSGDNITDPDAYRSLAELVNLLMDPPKNQIKPKNGQGNVMHDRVQVRLDWVKRAVSEKHFIFDPAKGRSVLRNDSKIKTHGKLYGLPKRYYDFLCGNELDSSSFMGSRDFVWMTREEFVKRTL